MREYCPDSSGPESSFPFPFLEGGYRWMVWWVADRECVLNAGQTY